MTPRRGIPPSSGDWWRGPRILGSTDERGPMCLMCEEQDLYFLALERRERMLRAARGEAPMPDPAWLWPAFGASPSARIALPPATKPRATFVCDTPGE